MPGFLKTILTFNLRRYFTTQQDHGDATVVLFPAIPDENLKVSVILPAKDEALYIESTLNALRNQVDDAGKLLPFNMYEVLLLVNNSKDASLDIAKAFQQKHASFKLHIANINLPKKTAHIGTVRRLLMDEAYRRLQLVTNNGIIASTDGDTVADAQWIYQTIKEIGKGNDVVGGRVISRTVNKNVRRYYLQDITYRYLSKKLETVINPCSHDTWPSHFQCYGASMAVRSSAYKKAGGLPAVPFLEDAAFCSASYQIDSKIRCSPYVKVYTSGRTEGKVKIGLSAHLTHLNNMHKKKILQYVENPEVLKIKFRNKQRLTNYWNNRNATIIDRNTLNRIAAELCIPSRWLYKQFKTAFYFGALWECVERQMRKSRKWRKKNKPVLITDAIQQLRTCFNN